MVNNAFSFSSPKILIFHEKNIDLADFISILPIDDDDDDDDVSGNVLSIPKCFVCIALWEIKLMGRGGISEDNKGLNYSFHKPML